MRISEGTAKEQRKFTGHEYDSDTNLTYANARYYNQGIGRWLGQDAVFQAVGSPGLNQITGQKLDSYLSNPQGFNSYSYAINNPLRLVDTEGEWFREFLTGQQSWSGFVQEVGDVANYAYNNSSVWKAALDHPVATGAAIGVTGGAVAAGGAAAATALSNAYLGGAGTACIAFCGQVGQRAIDYTSRYGSDLGTQMNQVSQNLQQSGYNFSDHAVRRIAQRLGAGNENSVLNALQNSRPFEYFHEGIQKLGYYDSATQVFVGQAKDSGNITTVITNATQNYINNLVK